MKNLSYYLNRKHCTIRLIDKAQISMPNLYIHKGEYKLLNQDCTTTEVKTIKKIDSKTLEINGKLYIFINGYCV